MTTIGPKSLLHMAGLADSEETIAHRIDEEAAARLLARDLPAPIDALNLIRFADERSYRWYGLLLAPVLLPRGARPVWVGVHERTICGASGWDEIVIIRYRTHRTVVEAVQSRYYSWVNRWRERGVRDFEFALTERTSESRTVTHSGSVLAVFHDHRGGTADGDGEALRDLLEGLDLPLIYSSREVSPLTMFSRLEPSDPNPTTYRSFAMFALPDNDALADAVDEPRLAEIEGVLGDCAIHVYRQLRNRDALPWSRLTARR